MRIRQRLSLLFTLLTGTVLFIFASAIYFSASNNREKEFYDLLKKEGLTKANLLFEADLDQAVLQEIYRRNREIIHEVEVAIYTPDFELIYHDAVDIDYVKETPEMIAKILKKGEKTFYQDKWQVVGTVFTHQGNEFIIVSAAYDDYGFTKLRHLRNNIFVVLLLSILVLYITGVFFARKALKPIQNMVDKAKRISAVSLDQRLAVKNKRDEIAQLAHTFNQMLDRLEHSFDAQKDFVYNISHEFRTPLAAIITELDLALHKERDNATYKASIQSVLNDAKKLDKISSSILDLARASYDTSKVTFNEVRLDEVLLDACREVQKSNSNCKTTLSFEEQEDGELDLTILGNEYLLRTACKNIIENACKYSADKTCAIKISFPENSIQIDFSDKGSGMDEKDKDILFRLFKRGENKNMSEGTGIGLPLTKKILDLHQAAIKVHSEKNVGTTISVYFKSRQTIT